MKALASVFTKTYRVPTTQTLIIQNEATWLSLQNRAYTVRYMPKNPITKSFDSSKTATSPIKKQLAHQHIFYKDDENTIRNVGLFYRKIGCTKIKDIRSTYDTPELTEQENELQSNFYIEPIIEDVKNNTPVKYSLVHNNCHDFVKNVKNTWEEQTVSGNFRIHNNRLVHGKNAKNVEGTIFLRGYKDGYQQSIKATLKKGKLHGNVVIHDSGGGIVKEKYKKGVLLRKDTAL